MSDYRRLISYIYSYENGIKTRNSGFARVESRGGVCKMNLSLRITEALTNEADDNMLEVFMFTRRDGSVYKTNIGRIAIANGNSIFRGEYNTEEIGNTRLPLSDIVGIFICSRAFLNRNSIVNIVYASEWDDTTIFVDEFTGDNEIADNEKTTEEAEAGIAAAELTYTKDNAGRTAQADLEMQHPDDDDVKIYEKQLQEILKNSDNHYEKQTDEQMHQQADSHFHQSSETDIDRQSGESNTQPSGEQNAEKPDSSINQQNSNSNQDINRPRVPGNGDYFRMLCNCYPKIRVEELLSDCIKITPHDISYLPKKYWHLCNNSFLLHSFYNYRYIFLCEEDAMENDGAEGSGEKSGSEEKRYMISVPGINQKKEQAMAEMYGFTEFKGKEQSEIKNFGYWCMYL